MGWEESRGGRGRVRVERFMPPRDPLLKGGRVALAAVVGAHQRLPESLSLVSFTIPLSSVLVEWRVRTYCC